MTKHEGSCCCGALSVSVDAEPLRVSICHCFDCQKRSGSVFAAQVRFSRDQVAVTGDYSTYTRTADSGNRIHFQFCSKCGGTISYYLEQDPEKLAIPVGVFSDPDFPPPVYSVYEDRMHSWIKLPEGMEHVH